MIHNNVTTTFLKKIKPAGDEASQRVFIPLMIRYGVLHAIP